MAQESKDGATKSGAPPAGVALMVAVVVIFAWLGFIVWLLVKVNSAEIEWSRLLVVLGSVEAVAFAAAGALFGTSVQRQRVQDQKARADSAENRASANESAAVNGQKLATAVKISRAPGARTAPAGTRERLSADIRPEPDPLFDLANRLFPD